jgi:FixJ family two-component response regulator
MAGRPRTVYVIDDEERVVRAFARLIRSASMKTVELSCVQDLSDIKTLDPEGCVVADIRMPGESGLTIPALLAERGSTLPVIFVTAVEDEETRLEAERVGAAAFLRKPVDDNELLTTNFGGTGHGLPAPAIGSGSGN